MNEEKRRIARENGDMKPWAYDLLLWIFSVIFDLFFREIHPRSSWKIPRKGPVIFVGAPHANQVRIPGLDQPSRS